MRTVGLLHPGEVGASIGAALRRAGSRCVGLGRSWARQPAPRARRGLTDAGTLPALVARSDLVLSVCPPHAAIQVARMVDARASSSSDAAGRVGSLPRSPNEGAGVEEDRLNGVAHRPPARSIGPPRQGCPACCFHLGYGPSMRLQGGMCRLSMWAASRSACASRASARST